MVEATRLLRFHRLFCAGCRVSRALKSCTSLKQISGGMPQDQILEMASTIDEPL